MLVICINGTINSGKSTVGLAVAQLLAPAAFIEVALSNRGGRILSEGERTRIRAMYEEGYAQRDFSDLVLIGGEGVQSSARRIVSSLRSLVP